MALSFLIIFICATNLIEALTINNTVSIIKNDCFERQAIGHRLKKSDVYKRIDAKTVQECQRGCTLEEDMCRTFSFGIGTKGNSTCEFSKKSIRETADLKPIGTILDEDYDLYVKKLGCKLVIEQKPSYEANLIPRPIQIDETPNQNKDMNTYKPHYVAPQGYGPGPGAVTSSNKPSAGGPTNIQTTVISIKPNPSKPQYIGISALYERPDSSYRPNRYSPSYSGYDSKPSVDYNNHNNNNNNYYYKPMNYYPSKPNDESLYQNELLSKPDYGLYHSYGKPEIHYQRPAVLHSNDRYDQPDFRPDIGYYRPIDPSMDEFRPHYDDLKPDSFWSYHQRPSFYEKPMMDGLSYNTLGVKPSYNPNYGRPMRPQPMQPVQSVQDSGYGSSDFERPNRPISEFNRPRPTGPNYRPDYRPDDRPSRPVIDPGYGDQNLNRPNSPNRPWDYERPQDFEYGRPPSRPYRPYYGEVAMYPLQESERPYVEPNFEKPKPMKPLYGYGDFGRPVSYNEEYGATYWDKDSNRPYDSNNPNIYTENNVKPVSEDSYNRRQDSGNATNSKPISVVSQQVNPYGVKITSIITEIKSACFKRVLAGKRVAGSLVRRSLACGRVDDCQQECQDEKRFVCEGFNYRLDPTGRGNGDCELLDLPMLRIDIPRDVYNDPDYDVYEKDRNAFPDCKGGLIPMPIKGPGGIRDRYDYYAMDNRRYGYGRPTSSYYDDRGPPPPPHGRPHSRPPPPPYYNRRVDGGYGRPNGYDHGPGPLDYGYPKRPSYLPSGNDNYGSMPMHYLPHDNPPMGIPSPYHIPSDDTYAPKPDPNLLPSSTYLPYDKPYGTTYGTGYGSPSKPNFGIVIPISGNNFGAPKPTLGNKEHPGYDYHDPNYNIPITEDNYPVTNGDTVEHKNDDNSAPGGYNVLKDECSLRAATGFRLHKIIVKKYYSVPDIYECETLCYKETDFNCNSYAYRYTIISNEPTDNCYLSNKNYKQLDFYTDLEPDRDFDIYTMNNKKKCQEQIPKQKEHSDCFWHVRSGQRFDRKVVRFSTVVKTVVECQLACLKSNKFLCRGFSFRFGSATIGGLKENCLLTDWPFQELNPQSQFVTESGFEIYDRGSFGYGCEPNHFSIRGKNHPIIGSKTDQLCYVGYGTPARLLPQVIRKSLMVNSELDCKLECTKHRHSTLFHCMSFSFRSKVHRGDTNCDLSDVLQRDLLSGLDYVTDPDSWLFAWDNYNPECVALIDSTPLPPTSHPPPRPTRPRPLYPPPEPSHYGPLDDYGPREEPVHIGFYGGYSPVTALDTWRVYTVSGWPCKRGSKCRQNRNAGFWYCQLEGGDRDTWDYCCHPDHQCGYSEGYRYQWCYVGPKRTQWRKCSDRYYPYNPHIDYREENSYLPTYNPHYYDRPPFVTDFGPRDEPPPRPRPHRPFRPRPRPRPPPKVPSLNQYEEEFDMQFLEPPKPSGFGQPRFWPVSYLHRELPPDPGNDTEYKFEKMKDGKGNRLTAIHNLIEIIKSNELDDIKYEIDNKTNLLVQIPLPSNLSTANDSSVSSTTEVAVVSESPKDTRSSKKEEEPSKEPTELAAENIAPTSNVSVREIKGSTYRKSYIVRTNVTNRAILETQ